MKRRFYIVRHGEKVKQIGNPPLSDNGVLQAKATGELFKTLPIQKIISSPILRAKQTAEHIANYLFLKITTHKLLRERVNWGDDPKQTFDEFLGMWKRASIDRDWVPPIGDSSRVAGNRLQRLINCQDKKVNHIILITHGGIITDFLRNTFHSRILNSTFKNFTKHMEENILECSITTIDFDFENQTSELLALASTKHLRQL